MGELLRVEHLRKVYEPATEAIGDLSFTMRAGELLCVVGPSGCGKTTLLKCLAGLLRPTGGVVEMHGAPVTGPSPAMAVVFQEYGRSLYPWLTVRGNVELPLRHKRLSRVERARLVADAVEAVGLAHVARSHPWQLSGGMQQRVAIARALAYEPDVLIMDEPFAAVDAQTRADLEDLVRDLHATRGISIVFVTHDVDEAVYLGERVLVLSGAPTRVRADLPVDLPPERDQRSTRALPRFTELRTQVYEQIQRAKRGQNVAP
ncbi:ABC transporter ATP-binding protein [Asanoa siamensis]|uniref:ABC transporter n=1 Tax=Asanoa siamensis TaxID=926357 RepID=A0ABQ4D1I7_9ACTN|nr:ABC transporter ATP-binding protein [Asanoa siamensis]GIF77397.1 ABC transporter [Asanoa siamensis]